MDSKQKIQSVLRKKWVAGLAGAGLLLFGLVAVNVVAGFIPLRLDVTQESVFSLSDGSRSILKGLEDPVTVKMYYSQSLGAIPVQVKQYATRVRELLKEYQNDSGGRLSVSVYDPKPDSEEEEWAHRYGISGLRIPQGETFYFGMVVLSGDREVPIPFFDPGRERFLEYDISQAITRSRAAQRRTIGVMGFLPGAQEQLSFPGHQGQREWVLFSELKKGFQMTYLEPSLSEVPPDVDVVMVIHPKGMSPRAQYALDQFVMRGGRLMVFVDPFARVEGRNPSGVNSSSSDLAQLFQGWGIQYNPALEVGDPRMGTATTNQSQEVFIHPAVLTFSKENMNQDLVITSQLERMILVDGGSIGVNPDFKYTFTPLLSTTAESGDLEVFSAQYFPPSQLSKNLKKNGKARVMAALITGRLESAFPDGPPPPEKGEKNPSPKGDGGRPAPHLKRAEKDVPVMVVGDADFMADPFAVKAIPFMGGQTLYQPLNDNLNFVLNGVEYLSGSQDLIRVRSRGTASRPFTTVLNLQRDAEQRFQAQEEQLRGKLQEVQTKLDQLQKQQQGKDVILSPEMVREVQSFRDEERRTRRELREVRQGLRQDIESLGNWLLLMNMLLMPLAVLGVGTAVYLRRTREGKRS